MHVFILAVSPTTEKPFSLILIKCASDSKNMNYRIIKPFLVTICSCGISSPSYKKHPLGQKNGYNHQIRGINKYGFVLLVISITALVSGTNVVQADQDAGGIKELTAYEQLLLENGLVEDMTHDKKTEYIDNLREFINS